MAHGHANRVSLWAGWDGCGRCRPASRYTAWSVLQRKVAARVRKDVMRTPVLTEFVVTVRV